MIAQQTIWYRAVTRLLSLPKHCGISRINGKFVGHLWQFVCDIHCISEERRNSNICRFISGFSLCAQKIVFLRCKKQIRSSMNVSSLIKQYFASNNNDVTIDVFDEKNIYAVSIQ